MPYFTNLNLSTKADASLNTNSKIQFFIGLRPVFILAQGESHEQRNNHLRIRAGYKHG